MSTDARWRLVEDEPGPHAPSVEVAVLVGLPGAGKSTFYRERLAGTHALVSKDLFLNARHRAARQRRLLEEALLDGRSVAVDNTNPSRAERAEIVAVARAHGAALVAYHFAACPSDCLARNRARVGRARVPDVAIFAALKRLEPPSRDEGFDAVRVVETLAPRGFAVREID